MKNKCEAHELQNYCCSHFGRCNLRMEETPNLTKLQTFKAFGQKEDDTNLVASHSVLFHLLKFALEFCLPLHFLLCTANIDEPAVQLLPIHLIYCLQTNKRQ